MKPGLIHNMPFADYLAAPGISNSLLTKFRRCPLLAYEHQASLIKDEPTDAMLIGKLTDIAVFEPDTFWESYHLQPEKYPATKGKSKVVTMNDWSNNATYCKEWSASRADKPIVTSKELSSVVRLAEAVLADPFASDLLKRAKYQTSLFALHPKTQLMRKGRPDGMGDGFLLDLKKVADASTNALSRAIANYGYYVQAAYYLDLCESLDIEAKDFYFVAVEPGQRPKVNVRLLNQASIDLGRWVYERDLAEYAECMASGVWPSYTGRAVDVVGVPAYEQTKVMGNLETIELES